MPLDPRISLASNPTLPDFGQMIDLGGGIMGLQQKRQEMQGQNALKQVFADPASVDATGSPTPNALRQIMQADPRTGMQFQQNMLRTQQAQLQTQMLGTKLGQQKLDMTTDANAAAIEVYDKAIANGIPEPQAREQAQQALTLGFDRINQSGLFSGTEAAGFQTSFDPQRSRNYVMQSADYRDQMRKNAADAERARHDRATEGSDHYTWSAGQGPSEDGQTVAGSWRYPTKGDEKPQFFPGIVQTSKTATGGYGKVETLEVTGADGKPSYVSGQQAPDGSWVTPDANRSPIEGVRRVAKGSEALAGDQGSIDQTAKMVASYQMAPLSSFAMRSPWGQAVMAKVGEMNPDYQSARYTEVNRAMSSFGTGKQGDQVRSFNVGIAHLDTLEEVSRALRNGDTQTLNRLRNYFREQFGSDIPTNFDAVKRIVSDEIVKAVVGSGGALGDREEAAKSLDKRQSPQQLEGAMQEYRNLMAGQMRGLRQQYQDATGFKSGPFSFDSKLLPETQRALERKDGGGGGAGASGQPKPQEFPGLPDPAVAKLRAEPNLAADFDRKYGAGSAKRVLGGT